MFDFAFLWAVAAVAFAVPLVISIVGTPGMARYLRHRQLLDHPNERSSHRVPTPRGAGVPLMAGILVVLLLYPLAVPAYGRLGVMAYLPLVGALLLALVSWVDDVRGLPAWPRLLAQVAVVGISVWLLPLAPAALALGLPVAAVQVGLALAWIWFINLYNFMDGIDGITGVETLAVALGFVAVAVLALVKADNVLARLELLPLGLQLPLALALIGGILGFLPFNWHPARIFLGDVGSVPLGFLVGWLMVILAITGLPAAALILPLYYLIDATATLTRRLLRGRPPWRAHREHYYQRATRAGRGHGQVAIVVLVADLLLVAAAAGSLWYPWECLAAAFAVALLVIAWMATRRPPADHRPARPGR